MLLYYDPTSKLLYTTTCMHLCWPFFQILDWLHANAVSLCTSLSLCQYNEYLT